MDTKKFACLSFVVCAALLFAMPASAAQIINGSFAGLGYATVSFTNLNFCPNGSTPNGANLAGACTPGTGNIQLAAGSGSFALPAPGVTGTLNSIISLSAGGEPVGSTVNLPLWMVFNPAVGSPTNLAPNAISLTLTQVVQGSFWGLAGNCPGGPAGLGQICTPAANSAFQLINTSTGSTASFQINGIAVDCTATLAGNCVGDPSAFTAIFSSNFNVPYQTLLADLAVGGGTGNYSSSYSVSVNATPSGVPEPMTMSMMGFGLVGLGLIARRRKK
jgi:hypothetical protein